MTHRPLHIFPVTSCILTSTTRSADPPIPGPLTSDIAELRLALSMQDRKLLRFVPLFRHRAQACRILNSLQPHHYWCYVLPNRTLCISARQHYISSWSPPSIIEVGISFAISLSPVDPHTRPNEGFLLRVQDPYLLRRTRTITVLLSPGSRASTQ